MKLVSTRAAFGPGPAGDAHRHTHTHTHTQRERDIYTTGCDEAWNVARLQHLRVKVEAS